MRIGRIIPAIVVAALAAGAVKFAEVWAVYKAKACAKGNDKDSRRLHKVARQVERLNVAVAQLQQLEAARQAEQRAEEAMLAQMARKEPQEDDPE